MKKIFIFLLTFCLTSFVFAQNNSITDVKITVTVPKYNEEGNLEEDVYEKAVPTTLEEAKRDIGTILSVYNTTIASYNKHIDDLEKEIEKLTKKIESVEEKNIEYTQNITELNTKINQAKENNDSITFLFPHFGISAGYGLTFEKTHHLVDLSADLYFSNFKLSVGPIIEINSKPVGDEKNIGFGFFLNLGYIFK